MWPSTVYYGLPIRTNENSRTHCRRSASKESGLRMGPRSSLEFKPFFRFFLSTKRYISNESIYILSHQTIEKTNLGRIQIISLLPASPRDGKACRGVRGPPFRDRTAIRSREVESQGRRQEWARLVLSAKKSETQTWMTNSLLWAESEEKEGGQRAHREISAKKLALKAQDASGEVKEGKKWLGSVKNRPRRARSRWCAQSLEMYRAWHRSSLFCETLRDDVRRRKGSRIQRSDNIWNWYRKRRLVIMSCQQREWGIRVMHTFFFGI